MDLWSNLHESCHHVHGHAQTRSELFQRVQDLNSAVHIAHVGCMSCRQLIAPRRSRKRHHLVLGDVGEYQAALQKVENAPTPEPPLDTFDVSLLPECVCEAMALSDDIRQPLLDAFKALHAERQSLERQHSRLINHQNANVNSKQTLSESRGARCAVAATCRLNCTPCQAHLSAPLAPHGMADHVDRY